MAGKLPPAFLKNEKGGDDGNSKGKPSGKGLAPPFVKGGKGGKGAKPCGCSMGAKCKH